VGDPLTARCARCGGPIYQTAPGSPWIHEITEEWAREPHRAVPVPTTNEDTDQ
jgi:hypothetical protein